MKKIKTLLSGLGIATMFFASTLLIADDHGEAEPEFAAAPQPPTLPDPVESGEVLEPEVTIRAGEDGATITEYRINGDLYRVKITPAVGPSYYLTDKDGDGEMDCKTNNIYEDDCVAEWVLFSW